MKTKKGLTAALITSTGLIAPALCLALTAAPSIASAQQAAAASTSGAAATTPGEIVVTGTAIRRLNYETPSPVDVVSNKQMQLSGFTTLSAVLTNITANGQGTLSNNNSEAFAGGASGIALRGLTVGATLTLVDGHRLAPYPLSDDGERPFVDVQSIPIGAVDHVEVLKDGASAIYGSDAIAGVVNIILKKQIVGFEATVEGGDSQHGGGAYEHVALSAGKGDLGTDGYNAFITAEYKNQEAVYFSQRTYEPWGNLNYTNIGGNDLRPGAPNVFNADLPPTLTPYLVEPNGSLTFLGSGCNTSAMAAGQCTYQLPQKLLAPTRNIDVLAGFTKEFGDGWEAKLRLSFFDSRGQQSNSGMFPAPLDTYPGASFGGNVSNTLSGIAVPGVGAVASFGLPANYLNSGSAAGAYLEGVIPQLGVPTINIDSKTYRAALDVTGQLWGWDVTGSMGFSQVDTNMTFLNYVNFDALYADLISGAFSPLGGNSQAVLNGIAPSFNNYATDQLAYGEVDATRKVMDLPGGDLRLAVGGTVIYKNLDNPGPAPVLAGTIGGTFSTYAIGDQTNVAEYIEADATLLHRIEIDAAARDDWYDTYGNSLTPKVGVKFKVFDPLTLRGTFSKGFRAPAPAEFGQSSTVFGLGGFQDPILCPGGSATAIGTVPAACTEEIGFVQKTTPTLKPETSTSFTGGAVFEPIHNWSTSIDYYNITINNQIVSESELPSYSFTGSNCVRGPDLPIAGVVVGYDAHGNPILGTAVPLAGPVDACSAGYVNAQKTQTSGIDLQSQYRLPIGPGALSLQAEWTRIFSYELTAPNGEVFQLAGTHGPSGISGDTGNPRNRINFTAEWDQGPFSVAATGYWISSFSILDPSASGGAQSTCAGAWNAAIALAEATPGPNNSQYCRVKSFTSVNLTTAYRVTPHVTLTFSVDDLFDASAPFDAETYGGGFTPVNPSLDSDGIMGRFFKAGVTYRF